MEDQTISLQPATLEDVPFMAGLITELGYPTTTEEMQQRMEAVFQQPGYHTLIARKDDVVCGLVGFLKIFFWEQNGCYVKIQSLVVKDGYRRHGIGALLLQACEDWCREHNIKKITLTSGNREERKAAHQFYPKMGYRHASNGYTKILA